MIEATCSACGALHRVSESSVPPGASFVTCTDCKARIAIAVPLAPAATSPKPPASTTKPPPLAVPPSKSTAGIDLADLPAPKRTHTLSPVPATMTKSPVVVRPPSRSGIMAALDPELPTPRSARMPGSIPPSASSPGISIDEVLAASAPGLASHDGGVDLPAPKKATHRPPLDPTPDGVTDLPAPKAKRPTLDLPKLKDPVVPAAASSIELPAPTKGPTISDLPAPTKGPTLPDLPAPRAMDPQSRLHGHSDLPAPKSFFDDLPQPSHQAAHLVAHDQAAHDQGPDLPAPKGFFDDLPARPSTRKSEAPAPKGFFDDLPAPASASAPDVPAPRNVQDDLRDDSPASASSATPEAPAPKGYFDDLPARPATSKPEAPAPKGYFDNLPARPATSRPEAPAPKGYFDDLPARPATSRPEAPAPKGYFDDLPARPSTGGLDLPDSRDAFEDSLPPVLLPQADGAWPAQAPAHRRTGEGAPGGARPDLAQGTPSNADASASDAVRFERGARSSTVRPVTGDPRPGSTGGMSIGLRETVTSADAPTAIGKRPSNTQLIRDGARRRRNRLVLGGALAMLVLGGGGFVLYQRHAAAQDRAATIAQELGRARAAYAASDWPHAAMAARHAIALDDKNPEALGIGAESLLASALRDGTAATAKIGQARALLDAATEAERASPALVRARALAMLVAHQPDGAIGVLQPLIARAPRDGVLALYLGWALAAKGDPAAAIKSFDEATEAAATRPAALYGRGHARLALADLDGARGDFSAILAIDKDHLGARVGVIAAQPPSASQQQEAQLLELLAQKDLANADPRAVAKAWTLAGTAALRDGRRAVARERFEKALGAVPQDLAATTGLAETELLDGKVPDAARLIAAVLQTAKDNVPAQLVQSEIELQQHKLPLASERLAALASHVTPLAPLEQARLQLLTGELLEAQGKGDEALDAYVQGARLARELDPGPLETAVHKLATMTEAAIDAGDPQRAAQLRARTEQLLDELAARAAHDARLATTLGRAYLQEGNAAKAESWLHLAVEASPRQAGPRLELGRALLAAGKNDEALEALSAAMGLEPARAEIGAELARTYEALGRDGDAGALYAKLIAGKDPSIELRTRAGRFFARTGALDKAGEQGARILDVDPGNAAGFYLQGEGLLAAGKPLEARQAFQRALEIDRTPQYLDALGRAAEALARAGDRAAQDLALQSYLDAAAAAPKTFNALAGQGRLYVARHEAEKAIPPLLAANKLEPKNADVMLLIGAASQELQQTAAAVKWLEASVKLAPSAEAYWRLGQIYRDLNRGHTAAAALDNATRLAAEAEQRTGAQVTWLTDALYLQGRVHFDLHRETRARDAWTAYLARNPPASAQLTEVKQLLATSLRH